MLIPSNIAASQMPAYSLDFYFALSKKVTAAYCRIKNINNEDDTQEPTHSLVLNSKKPGLPCPAVQMLTLV